MESLGLPVVIGEWSLATVILLTLIIISFCNFSIGNHNQDNCAMWLNGFNDNVDGYPKVQCDMIPCPPPYMGPNQPGAPPDSNLGKQGPFGTGNNHLLFL